MGKPQGQLVKVKGRNMHVRRMGNGEKTIVLLPGWNMPLPSVEFAPLMRGLSKKYTVCTIEYFGYGYSDSIDTPRTNENYMQEIKSALSLVGLKPPYILMPYSCSGIYCEYYASKYPEEVSGLILLDCTSTAEQCEELAEDELEELGEIANSYNSAISSLKDINYANFKSIIYVDSMDLYQLYLLNGYTEEEIFETSTVPNHMDTLVAQYIALSMSAMEVMSMDFPKEIPILMLGSDTGYEDNYSELMEVRKCHMDKLGGRVKLVIIEGSEHSDIYYSREVILKAIEDFLESG